MTDRIAPHLRRLRAEDAPRMHEWMQNKDVVEHLHADFQNKTLQNCLQFIQDSLQTQQDLHLAVVDTADTYMGTVSLKGIDQQTGTAEFGICMHPDGMGKGMASAAMAEILSYGFRSLGLRTVYWCVSIQNARANRFYQKNGYQTTQLIPEQINCRYQEFSGELVWYCAEQGQDTAG